MAITPSPFMFLEADADKGLLHFVASTPDGHAQIAGAGNLWAVAVLQAEGTYTLGDGFETPQAAAAALAERVELMPYIEAEAYCSWRERMARQRLAKRKARHGKPGRTAQDHLASLPTSHLGPAARILMSTVYARHVPPAPRGFTLAAEATGGVYRFYAGIEPHGEARVYGRGTNWVAEADPLPVDTADPGGLRGSVQTRLCGVGHLTPELAAAAIASDGHALIEWPGASNQQRQHPHTIPLIDEDGDPLWVVDRDAYYRLGDLSLHPQPTQQQRAVGSLQLGGL